MCFFINFRASSAPHRSLPDIPNADNENGSVYETVVHENPNGIGSMYIIYKLCASITT